MELYLEILMVMLRLDVEGCGRLMKLIIFFFILIKVKILKLVLKFLCIMYIFKFSYDIKCMI